MWLSEIIFFDDEEIDDEKNIYSGEKIQIGNVICNVLYSGKTYIENLNTRCFFDYLKLNNKYNLNHDIKNNYSNNNYKLVILNGHRKSILSSLSELIDWIDTQGKIDIILIDGCRMLLGEFVSLFEDKVDLIISSPEAIPVTGLPYHKIFDLLQNDIKPYEFSTELLKVFNEHFNEDKFKNFLKSIPQFEIIRPSDAKTLLNYLIENDNLAIEIQQHLKKFENEDSKRFNEFEYNNLKKIFVEKGIKLPNNLEINNILFSNNIFKSE